MKKIIGVIIVIKFTALLLQGNLGGLKTPTRSLFQMEPTQS